MTWFYLCSLTNSSETLYQSSSSTISSWIIQLAPWNPTWNWRRSTSTFKIWDVSKVKFVALSHGLGYIHSYSNFQQLNFGQKRYFDPSPSVGMFMPITRSSDTLSDGPSEKYVTMLMGSMEFLTAVIQSSQSSTTSLKSFPTISGSNSDYIVIQLPYCAAWNLPNCPGSFHQKLLISLLIHSQLSWEIYLWKLPPQAWLLLLESWTKLNLEFMKLISYLRLTNESSSSICQ